MSRKPAIHDAEPHVVVSHGADFFGQDRHPIKDLYGLALYVDNAVPYLDRDQVADFVQLLEAPEDRTFAAAEAEHFSQVLLKVARMKGTKPAVASRARALADAAARAAESGEPWTWLVENPATAAA